MALHRGHFLLGANMIQHTTRGWREDTIGVYGALTLFHTTKRAGGYGALQHSATLEMGIAQLHPPISCLATWGISLHRKRAMGISIF